MKIYSTTNKRLRRYLYVLGFETIGEDCVNDKGKELYRYDNSDKLKKCIDFFFEIRGTMWRK